MSKYGLVAKAAAHLLSAGKETVPRDAWTRAAFEVFPHKKPSRDKSCPRSAFLSLCELGAVKGVPPGVYSDAGETKNYMRRAWSKLSADQNLLDDERRLWSIATVNAGTTYNHQISVLTSLWKAGFIHSSSQPLV